MNTALHIPILHVEDTPEDIFLLRYAFSRVDIRNPVHVVTDGQEAIDYLDGSGRFHDRKLFPLPGLILLDLKLPQKMGLEVLEWIRSHPRLKSLIVVVLSSSAYPGDIERAYEIGVNAFLVKPSDAKTLADICAALKHFWLHHNHPPELTR